MVSPTDFRAAGRILRVEADAVIFQPVDTSYELRLLMTPPDSGPPGRRVEALIRLAARKIYSVPGGGGFIAPIVGPPRIVQGRVRHLDESIIVVHAGAPIVVELPKDDAAYDLTEGPLAVGAMVNVVASPGARIEDIRRPI